MISHITKKKNSFPIHPKNGQGEGFSQPVSCALSIFKLSDGTYAYRFPNGFKKLFHAKLLDSVGGN